MISKKHDNWYTIYQSNINFQKEAGVGNKFKLLLLAISLVLSGLTIEEASKKTNITEKEISDAIKNPKIIEESKKYTYEENKPEESKSEETEVIPDATIDFDAIVTFIRNNEVSGKQRYVTVNGKTIDICKVYPDPIHGWKAPTIGVGFNLNNGYAKSEIESLGLNYEDVKSGRQMITEEQVDYLFKISVAYAIADAKKIFVNFAKLPKEIKMVLVDMSFNLGFNKLNAFEKLKLALSEPVIDYKKVKKEMIDSKWYNQVGGRSKRDVKIVEKYIR